MFHVSTNAISLERDVTCSGCGESKHITKRLPKTWKRRDDAFFCGACWHKKFVLRAIIIPVAGPVSETWEELRSTLRVLFRQTTSLSNWMISQLASLDVKRVPEQTKMPSMPRTYLYPEARRQFPDLPPQTVSSLEQTITATYRAARFDLVWACSASLPNFRYPQPFPIHNQSWTAETDNNSQIVKIRLADRHVRLRLKGGPRFRRQAAVFKQLISGEAHAGQLCLYERDTTLMCKIVTWVPRREANEHFVGTLYVRTSCLSESTARKSLLTATNEKSQCLWQYHADHTLQWGAAHRSRLKRWQEDSKVEIKPAPFAQRRQSSIAKYRNRLRTACDQAASALSNYALRRRFAEVRYDDTDTSFFPEFAWHRLRERLSTTLSERGIEFQVEGAAHSQEKEWEKI